MRLWRRKEFIGQAMAWRNAEESRLVAECRILEAMLRASRDELAEVRNLHGRKLMARYGWEANHDDSSAEWMNEIETTWLAGQHNLKAKEQAA